MMRFIVLQMRMMGLLFGPACGSDRINVGETRRESSLMPQPIVEFTDEERQVLRCLQIAVFRNKIILDAQLPITDAQLAEIETRVDGKVSPELLALWTTSFGGALDYDYEIAFGDHLYSASLRELFYPGSDHYHDLYGWIERELEIGQEIAEERGLPLPERTPFIPFGGFEYLERFYVSLRPEEYGSVVVYAQGIPWKGRLNKDSVPSVASSVTELFDQLSLDEDPLDEKSDEYANGKDMVERIHDVEVDHPDLARKLKDVVRSSIFDWHSVIETTDFTSQLSAKESKALRRALEFAVNRQDVGVLDQLHEKAAPFNITLHGTGGVLGFAMTKQAFGIVNRLLDLNVDVGTTPIIHATECSDELLLRLIKFGVRFDEEAVYSAAETGSMKGAIALVNCEQIVEPKTTAQIAASAVERAVRHDEDAVNVETGKLRSYLTAGQYRERAKALRDFADRLRNGEMRKQTDGR
jgi:hypothetical protein